MVEIWLPYGSSEIPVRVPEERLVEILTPPASHTLQDLTVEVCRSMEANETFLAAVRRARRICIAVGPSGNSNASASTIKALVDNIRTSNAQSSILILRTADAPEIDPGLLADVEMVKHDSGSACVPLRDPRTSYALSINERLAEAELPIVVGELKPHCLLERNGVTDIILPGLASSDSVQNHLCREDGSLANIHKERVEVAESIENLFGAGFVLNADRSLASFSFGEFPRVLKELDTPLRTNCTAIPKKTADIVVMSAGGKPTDESLLRAAEAFPQGLAAVKRGGALIVAAECPLGHGGTEFYEWCAERKEPRYLEARLRHRFNYNGFKAALLTRAVEGHRVYLVSTIPDHYVEGVFGMKAAVTVNSALQAAQRALGSDSEVTVIPDATRIIVEHPQSGTG